MSTQLHCQHAETAVDQFKLCLANEENSVAVAAIKTLLHLIKCTKGVLNM